MNIKNITVGIASMLCLTGCYDLNKSPEGVMSTVGAFSTIGEMNSYLDQFYETAVFAQGFGWNGNDFIASGDIASDNMSGSSINTRLNGAVTLANASKLTNYTYIRNVNFFLNNLTNCNEIGSQNYKQCVGEGYFFRAWYYFQLFKNYGELTWIEKPLDPNAEEMHLPRENRTVIADNILADLDKAIENLNVQNNSSTMRIHKDVARALKSEVALFEATWEKYHKAKNDPFYDKTITDEKIKSYLNQCVEACKDVVDRNVWHIYSTGNKLDDYRALFQIEDLSTNSEILWFKHYDAANIGNNVDRYLNRGGGSAGVTKSLVDDYLTIDGKPFVGSQVIEAKKVFGEELKPTVRDPRLAQTVCMPGQILRPDEGGYVVPPLNGSSYNKNETGYSLLKHVQIDYKGSLDAEFRGATPGIQYRYADILLNYAEALAELGGAQNAAKIIEVIKPLRDRVGMPQMDFDREYNNDADYPFRGLDKYVQAVRRERRVEQAAEGKRFYDIMRWAAADELIVGKHAEGALFKGSNLDGHAQYGNALVYDQATGNNLFLSGTALDTYRYILPVDPKTVGNGWGFDVNRDYLLPIQPRMLQLTENQWKQNPGW